MKLIIEQSLELAEPEITIRRGLIDEPLRRLIEQVRLYSFSITGRRGESSRIFRLEEVFYFESVDERTYLYCEKEVYECDPKLYELERQLENTAFVRVSKSCILNTARLESVRALAGSRMEAKLENGESVVISRHYLPAFKEKFGL